MADRTPPRSSCPTCSLYLHCDPTASHYLRLLLDEIIGAKALIGLLITLNPASAAAAKEAVSAGFVEVDMGTGTTRLRKLQILTVEELMNGVRPELPIVDSTAFRRARREDTEKQSELDL